MIKLIEVNGVEINVLSKNQEDYISLTDMTKGFGDDSLIYNWLRNKNTVEFLGIWEQLNNPNFKGLEFETFKNEAGANRFSLTPKKWIESTAAIGIMSKSGRYGGGTFAHKDIAFEFGSWLSPEFKLYLIKEFQRLKLDEAEKLNINWDFKRLLSKVNYKLHTDAVKHNLLPTLHLSADKEKFVYADEADVLNIAIFGKSARQWKQDNASLALQGGNIRDYADLHELTVLANLESYNSILMKQGVSREIRTQELRKQAIEQLESLRKSSTQFEKIKSPNLIEIEQSKNKKS
jgi:hypothetical protein